MSGHSKWATIKRKKAATDSARGRLFTRLIKEIAIAAREGGGNIDGNPRLRLAVQTAKDANMPADNIKRGIQRGTGELPGVTYEEITYEGYGPAGIAILVEVVTDNANRTVSEMRHLFSRHSGNLGQAGSVAWMFDKKGVITIPRTGANSSLSEEDVMGIVLEPGADDLQVEEEVFTVTTEPASFEAVRTALETRSVKVENAQVQMIPQSVVKVSGKEAGTLLKLLEALEEHDDVQNVHSNFDIDEDELASLQDHS